MDSLADRFEQNRPEQGINPANDPQLNPDNMNGLTSNNNLSLSNDTSNIDYSIMSQSNNNNSINNVSYENMDDDPNNIRLKQDKDDKKKKEMSKKEKVKDDQESDKEFEKQLKELEKPLKHKQVHILYKIMDIDNDKNLTFKEFLRLIR